MSRGRPCVLAAGAAVLLAASLGGCSWKGIGRSLGRGAADAGVERLRDPKTRLAVDEFADSALGSIASSFEDRLRPSISGTVRGTLDSVTAALDGMEEDLAVSVEGRLSGSLKSLVSANVRGAGEEARAQLRETTRQLGESVRSDLAPALRQSVIDATEALMHSLSEGVRTELAAAAESALVKTVRGSVRAGTKEGEPFLRKILYGVGGVLATVIGLVLWWLRRERQRSIAAIDVIAGEVSRGAPALKASIKQRAMERGVEGWLHEQLARKGHL